MRLMDTRTLGAFKHEKQKEFLALKEKGWEGIDVNMIPILEVINVNHMIPIFSCEGHDIEKEDSGYLCFINNYNEKVIDIFHEVIRQSNRQDVYNDHPFFSLEYVYLVEPSSFEWFPASSFRMKYFDSESKMKQLKVLEKAISRME